MLELFVSRQWRPHYTDRFIDDIEGKRIIGAVMRRRVLGKFEYREVNEDETVVDEWVAAIRD